VSEPADGLVAVGSILHGRVPTGARRTTAITATTRRTVAEELTREEAARLLGLGLPCSPGQVKRAYRRQARQHHPDRGGDARVFHALQRAYERLSEGAGTEPRELGGRPSRTPAAAPPVPSHADLARLDHDRDLPPGRARLDTDLLASALARPHPAPLHPLVATSRAPGSLLNGAAPVLAADLTARLAVVNATTDLQEPVVRIEVVGGARRARRALERAPLEGVWTRRRRSSTTELSSAVRPADDRHDTAGLVAWRVARLLEQLSWPLPQWTLTPAEDIGR